MNRGIELERVNLGQFECSSGELVISDPCYDEGIWCSGVVDARRGRWLAQVEVSDEGSWGKRVALLRAMHEDCRDIMPLDPVGFEVGVDSGQAGVFDKSLFKRASAVPEDFKHHTGAICPDEPWYSYICDHTLREGVGAAVVNGGVVSSSGFGDGGYVCLVAKQDGDVVALEIRFITEDDSEDD